MMNQPCPMIQDLLPLYVDQICSQESRRAVEEHVENCPSAVPGWRSCAGKTRCPARAGPGAVEGPGAGRGKKAAEKEKAVFLRSGAGRCGSPGRGGLCWSFASRHPFPIHRISASRRWSRLST